MKIEVNSEDFIKKNKMIFDMNEHLRLDGQINQARNLIIDGPISEKYFGSQPKILWVLKEAHSDKGGGSLIKHLNNDFIERDIPGYPKWHTTWGLIVKVSHAILFNNFIMSDYSYRDIKTSLRHIAAINLNKFGGGETESDHYHEGSQKCKNIVQDQYKLLDPDIVIFGGTSHYLSHLINRDIDIQNFYPRKSEFPYIKDGKKTFIAAYHTNQKELRHTKYCEYICAAISM